MEGVEVEWPDGNAAVLPALPSAVREESLIGLLALVQLVVWIQKFLQPFRIIY